MREYGFEPNENLNFKLVDTPEGLVYLEQNIGFKFTLGPIKDILNVY